jgi:thioredoxin
MQHLTDSNFRKVLSESNVPVLVDFWAEWCGPCRMFAPTFEKLANELGDKALFVKVDVEENPVTTSEEKVGALPMLAVYYKGKRVAMKTGIVTDKVMREMIDSAT